MKAQKMARIMSASLLLFVSLTVTSAALSRHDFPATMGWGCATAAWQVEGAWNSSGKGPSIWDVWTHEQGQRFGDVADDEYNVAHMENDVKLLASLGFSHYRLSISWPRIVPTGRFSEGINQRGLQYYARVLATLDRYGIIPVVTLFHWDTPYVSFFNGSQTGPVGWLRKDIVQEFVNYATLIFKTFPNVPYYLTFNEPLSFIWDGYGSNAAAPGRCSNRSECPYGNSATEPYAAGHNVLLAHAYTVAAYRALGLRGKIGITLDLSFAVPLSSANASDVEAAERSMEFQVGWWADPIYRGDYPASMRAALGNRLPRFTSQESKLIRGSHDFFGLNHYTSAYVTAGRDGVPSDGWKYDQNVQYHHTRNGVPIGTRAASSWLWIYPPGMRGVLQWVSQRYGDPIYITENGVDVPGEANMTLPAVLNDTFRSAYYEAYLENVHKAITIDGVDVRGYFAWSLLDNVEWASGVSLLFGITWVDRHDQSLRRYPKNSAEWWKRFLRHSNK